MYLIEATSKSVSVEDLRLFVGYNLPKTITEEQYKSSVCLAELVKRGQLRISKTSLCREEIVLKPSKKKKTLSGTPSKSGILNPQEQVSVPERVLPVRENYISREELSNVVSTAIDNAVRRTVAALSSAAPTSPLPQPAWMPVEPLRSSSRGAAKPAEEFAVNGDAPMFIPTGLVPKDSSLGITITSESQSSEDLGDSAAALKKLRKGASK